MLENFKQMVVCQEVVFILFANCKIVQGKGRSIICDFNGRIFIVPSKYSDLVPLLLNPVNLTEINCNDLLKQFIKELEIKQMGAYLSSNEAQNFKGLEVQWNSPYQITNAILDIDFNIKTNWGKFVSELNDIGCQFLQIRVFGEIDFSALISVLSVIAETEIYSIQLFIPFNAKTKFEEDLQKTVQAFPQIVDVVVYNSNSTDFCLGALKSNVRLTNDSFSSHESCGKIGPAFFSLNIDFFMESMLFNNCLNRKITLTKEGYIKNCPSMMFDFGNINEVNLSNVITNEKFYFWWSIKKDDIEVCCDCEFRYICSDCRAFIKNSSNPYSKPSKCNYNPYNCNGF